ncbi:phospholipase A2 inhibitor CNF-like isoform X2 [Myripristis murdjan]|uniref:phospholipase A2 inhibitor CNF-like isoform X2 n=1 Tax=Myripristis murdjan TaxID=586833 RepID=UPI0011764102|nr:phospholipase A2 inhibitor CNF-like isoform X2 [Myripristis murdjan]
MKLLLSLCLIWVLVNTAEALDCLMCRDFPQCEDTFSGNCSSDELCATAAIRLQQMGSSLLINTKSCVPPSLCDVGNGTFSGSLGFMRVVGSVRCCDTDNCNSQTLPIPADQESNGFECYSCDSSTCRHKIQCVGVEDRCFNGNVTHWNTWAPTVHVFGCASSNLCVAFSHLSSASLPGFDLNGPNCCEGKLCN